MTDVPVVPASPDPAGTVVPVVAVVPHVAGVVGETVGIVGTTEVPAVPVVGDTLIVGIAGAELTPRLLISVDPSGIPVRAPPPGVVGDVDVGVDDEAVLLEPEPHIPDDADVSRIPEDVDIPDVAVVLDVVAVEGAGDPIGVPPPSNAAVDPNIPDGEVPAVEQAVPLPGIAMVPVEELGSGLIPGDASSVAPKGIPVGESAEPVAVPSGDVSPIVGVGVAVSSICAMATLQTKSAGRTAAIDGNLIGVLRF